MDVEKLCDKIWPIVWKYKNVSHVEMEMRLGKFNGKMFDTNVGKATFDRMLIGLKNYTEWEQVRTIKSEVFYRQSDGVRITVDETTNEETIVRKERVKNEDFKKLKDAPYDVRFSVSSETPLTRDQNWELDKKKTKDRMSFIRKNLSIDMTVCVGDSHDIDSEDTVSYQIELEIIDPSIIQTREEMFNIIHKIKDVFNLLNISK